MDDDPLVVALGADAADAVAGYRSAVVGEAARRGTRLVGEPGTDHPAGGDPAGDPIDIRLRFLPHRERSDLGGRTLSWCPARGWSMSHYTASCQLSYYAGPAAAPVALVPPAPALLDWALGDLHGPEARPPATELDDDPEAIRRLLSFVDAGPPPDGSVDATRTA